MHMLILSCVHHRRKALPGTIFWKTTAYIACDAAAGFGIRRTVIRQTAEVAAQIGVREIKAVKISPADSVRSTGRSAKLSPSRRSCFGASYEWRRHEDA